MIKVNKRIPLSFFINVLLQTVAMISRALNELIFDNESWKIPRILITAASVGLIEISFAYFVFQIQAFRIRMIAESPQLLKNAL